MRWRRQIGAEPYPFGPLPKRKRHHERFWRFVQRILAETLAMTSIYRKPAPHANTAIEVSVNAGEVRDQTLGRLEFWTLRLQRDRVGGPAATRGSSYFGEWNSSSGEVDEPSLPVPEVRRAL
jgi:hypothetical protein